VYSTLHEVLVRCDETELHPGYLRPEMTVMDLTAALRPSALLREAAARSCHFVSPGRVLAELVARQARAGAGGGVAREPLLGGRAGRGGGAGGGGVAGGGEGEGVFLGARRWGAISPTCPPQRPPRAPSVNAGAAGRPAASPASALRP